MADVVVTQEDRIAWLRSDGWTENEAFWHEVVAGKHDNIAGIHDFARHRIAARKQALEEAAKVADKYAGMTAARISSDIRAIGDKP